MGLSGPMCIDGHGDIGYGPIAGYTARLESLMRRRLVLEAWVRLEPLKKDV